MQETLSKIRTFWKRIIKKPLKRQIDFFLCTSFLFMDKITKNKKRPELVTSLKAGFNFSKMICEFSLQK